MYGDNPQYICANSKEDVAATNFKRSIIKQMWTRGSPRVSKYIRDLLLNKCGQEDCFH